MCKLYRFLPISQLLLCSIVTAFLIGLFLSPPLAKAAGPTVNVWLTTSDGSNQLTPQANLTFGSNTGNSSTISVNEYQEMQQMDGFGAAVTDSSAWLMYNKMSTSQRNTLVQNLFDPNQGIGLSFVRIPMGASDFSVNGPYSYDDLSAGQTDPNLNNFSINHDLAYIIPILQQAHSLNPNLKFMANPWSPPAWMKTNGSMLGVYNDATGTLISSDYEPLAQYFVKFIRAYQAQGIPIYAITPQNEPLYVPTTYPGMSWAASDEDNFIKNNLSPALSNAGLSPKIIPYDHNWDNTDYANTLLGDSTTRSDIVGISWHCYSGNPSSMTTVRNNFPTSEVYETECSSGTSEAPISTIDLLMQSVQNWSRTVELWNIALDSNNGPHTGGCADCLGTVTIDQSTGNVTYHLNDYYQLGQFSKFVVPGAYHIASNTLGSLADVAFKNPDGSKVVVAHNDGSSSSNFQVLWGNQGFNYTLPAGATVTFKWSGTQPTTISGGGYNISAGNSSGSGSFQGDNYYLGGSSNTASTNDTIDTSGVSSPAPQAVYQSERYGNFSYVFPGLSAGASYNVSLHFAETYWSSSGQRVFNVSINGSQVLSNFDIIAATGAKDKAIIEQFNAIADNNGQITIQFSSVVDYAKVDGLMIVPTNGTITVDDSVQGSAVNQFNYVGNGWGHCSNCDNNNYGFYNGSNSWDNTANDYVTITFNGTQIRFYGVVGPPHGIGAFSIDGGSETTRDFYSPTNAGNTLLYVSPVLAAGQHTLKVRVTGNQSSQATWNGINPDRVDIISHSVITIDDSVQGSAVNQFNYVGNGWGHCSNCDNNNYGFYNGSNSWDNTANDYVTITFNGTQIEFYGVVGPPHGIGAFSIDGGSETTLDFYSSTNAGNTLLYISPVLAAGQHTLKVRVTGNQSSQATWNGINPDRVDIIS